MTDKRINEAIRFQGVVEIEYLKPAGLPSESVIRHITDIEESSKYGSAYIDAYCLGSHSVLTFKKERIKRVEWIWRNIYDQDMSAPNDGLYVIVCRGDNHLVFEMYQLKRGEKFWDYFLGENLHCDGWFVVEPLSFHFVDLYSASLNTWNSDLLQKDKKEFYEDFELFAFKKNGEIVYSMEITILFLVIPH